MLGAPIGIEDPADVGSPAPGMARPRVVIGFEKILLSNASLMPICHHRLEGRKCKAGRPSRTAFGDAWRGAAPAVRLEFRLAIEAADLLQLASHIWQQSADSKRATRSFLPK
jgi:hypothetical protein